MAKINYIGGDERDEAIGLIDELYRAYPQWKCATREVDEAAQQSVYAREIARLGVRPGSRLLEIGFGEGLFLDWAREAGFAVAGVEISASYIKAAQKKDHIVYLGTIDEVPLTQRYNAIIAFDVLEHLRSEGIVELFQACFRLLEPGGVILARFPNGGSPLGGYSQNGDATHLSVLTALKVDQLAFLAGLKVTAEFSALRPLCGDWTQRINTRLQEKVVSLLERFAGRGYFGQPRPLGPNMVVHLSRRTVTG